MNRRRVIIVLAAAYYAFQMLLLAYWHTLARPELRSLDVPITAVVALVLGGINWYAVHYLLQALSRTEQVYAEDVSQQLQHSLESYQRLAEREDQRAREIGNHVEAELVQARADLARGHTDDATRHMLQGLDIASAARSPLCANVAVAAILEVKSRECESAGVQLVSHVDIPTELGLPEIEVASLLFNLIDNALHECEALIAEGAAAEPEITLQGRIQAGQLFIQVSNPCREGTHTNSSQLKIERGGESAHGWGTDIVRTLARRNGGIAEFKAEGGTFTASVMIPVSVAQQ